MNGSIVLENDGKTITINGVSIEDENLYLFLREVEEDKRVETIIGAIKIGIIGLKRLSSSGEIDYVEKEFNKLLEKFERNFDPEIETSYMARLLTLLKEYFDKGGTVESMLDPSIESTPLGKLREQIITEFRREIRDLRDKIVAEEERDEITEITTLKGYKFEDACESILSEYVSRNFGDELERTSKELGEITGSFAGDFVISLRDFPDKKIVIETKDVDRIAYPKIIENLENAMKNRDAKYGIFVAKYKESLPKKVGWFNEYRGNMLVCAMGSKENDTFFPEILNIAYQWAKLRVEKEFSINERARDIIREGIKELETNLDNFSKIQTQCTNIEESAAKIREISKKLEKDIKEKVQKINEAIKMVAEETR